MIRGGFPSVIIKALASNTVEMKKVKLVLKLFHYRHRHKKCRIAKKENAVNAAVYMPEL